MNVSILLLVCLVLPKYIAATVHIVIAGDINDLISTLGLVADYDTVLIPPGDYVFDLIDEIYRGGGDLCWGMPAVPGWPALAPNLLIRGTGSSHSEVKLVATVFWGCKRNVVIENLSLYMVHSGPSDSASIPVEWQNRKTEGENYGFMLRNIYLQVPVDNYPDCFVDPFEPIMTSNARIAVMYSTIETNPQVPSMGANTGITEKTCDDGCGLSVIRSTFAGFTKGLDLYLNCNPNPYNYTWCEANPDVDELNRNYKIYGNDLSQNTIPIDGDPTVINLFSPNTPQGKNYFVNTFIDILRYTSYNDAPYVPIKIRVNKAKKAGETTIYRVPSAYPEPPPGFISASEPQYYQFDSTAKFGKKSKVFFKQSDIQSKFPGFSGSLTCMYHNGTTWNTVSHVVIGGWYKITFPKKSMKGLIAIFKN